jgi:hypothetical protein
MNDVIQRCIICNIIINKIYTKGKINFYKSKKVFDYITCSADCMEKLTRLEFGRDAE